MDTLLNALRAVAEPTRIRLMALCSEAELSVSELCRILGQSQPRVSRHLKLMMEAGLLVRNQEGARAFFRPAADGDAAALARFLAETLPADDPMLATDRDRLARIKAERAREAESFFERNAADWDHLRGLHVDDAEVDRHLKSVVLAQPVGDLLDIGTGTGRVLRVVGPHVASAIGVDKSREMLAVARAFLDREELRNCQVRLADMYGLPFPAGRFDVVTANMLLRYAEQPSAMIEEAARVLKPGGRLIVVDFAPHGLIELREEHKHQWLGFSDRQVARLLGRAGLAALEPQHLVGDPLTVCIWSARKAPVAVSAVPGAAALPPAETAEKAI